MESDTEYDKRSATVKKKQEYTFTTDRHTYILFGRFNFVFHSLGCCWFFVVYVLIQSLTTFILQQNLYIYNIHIVMTSINEKVITNCIEFV